jgi:hypothetical protein
MGSNVLRFPKRRHARASSSSPAGRRAKISAVTPAAFALSVDKTLGHHLDGIVSLRHHLMTAQLPAPTSAAMASRELQSSITDRKDAKGESEATIGESLGQTVPICKANMSRDMEKPVGHSVPMIDKPEKIAESAWRKAFRERLKRIQGRSTHEEMAEYFEMSVESWKKCVNRGSVFPTRKLPKLAFLAKIPIESLIKGDKDAELPPLIEKYKKRKMDTPKRRAS